MSYLVMLAVTGRWVDSNYQYVSDERARVALERGELASITEYGPVMEAAMIRTFGRVIATGKKLLR